MPENEHLQGLHGNAWKINWQLMWQSDFGWILSPAYDLLNVNLILPKDKEESALLA